MDSTNFQTDSWFLIWIFDSDLDSVNFQTDSWCLIWIFDFDFVSTNIPFTFHKAQARPHITFTFLMAQVSLPHSFYFLLRHKPAPTFLSLFLRHKFTHTFLSGYGHVGFGKDLQLKKFYLNLSSNYPKKFPFGICHDSFLNLDFDWAQPPKIVFWFLILIGCNHQWFFFDAWFWLDAATRNSFLILDSWFWLDATTHNSFLILDSWFSFKLLHSTTQKKS